MKTNYFWSIKEIGEEIGHYCEFGVECILLNSHNNVDAILNSIPEIESSCWRFEKSWKSKGVYEE